jgi:hypothetical protein
MDQIRLNVYDQAIKSVVNLTYLVERLGLYVAGSPEEIKSQLENRLADEMAPAPPGPDLHVVKNA